MFILNFPNIFIYCQLSPSPNFADPVQPVYKAIAYTDEAWNNHRQKEHDQMIKVFNAWHTFETFIFQGFDDSFSDEEWAVFFYRCPSQ